MGTTLDDIEWSVIKTDDPLVFHAPSSWHAALYCHMLQHHLSLAGSQRPEIDEDISVTSLLWSGVESSS